LTKFLHVINREAPAKQQAQSINHVTQVSTVSNVTSELTGAGVSMNALPIVPLILRNPITLAEVQTYALLDSDTTNSFCSSEIVQQLGLHDKAEKLNLTTLNTDQRVVDTALVSLELCSVDKTVVMEISEVFVVEKVLMNVSNKVKPEDVKAWPHLTDIQLPEADSSNVGFLIGQSCPDAMVPLEIRRGEASTPYAVRTVFGWTVNGPVRRFPAGLLAASVNFVQSSSVLECQTERLWMLDEVPDSASTPLSVNDRKTLDIWNDSMRQCDGRYQLAIPFKDRPPRLYNHALVMQRLNSFRRKLLRDPELHTKYVAYMNDLIAKGYTEKVSSTIRQVLEMYGTCHIIL